jgi:sialate O-acetylesterase
MFIMFPLNAEIRLPAIIGDNMVIQQGINTCIWGWAETGENVMVSMAGLSAKDTADSNGKWKVTIGPFTAGGPYEMIISGKNMLILKNILVGEVWLASGQSNMEWQLQASVNGAEEVARANYPEIRLFTVTRATSLRPCDDVRGCWDECTPGTARSFSAVAYFFGRELNRALNVPVGLIHSSWGGTPAEAWTERTALVKNPQLKPILDKFESDLKNMPEAMIAYKEAQEKWEKQNLLQDPGNKGLGLGYARPDFNDQGWQSISLPQPWELTGINIDGAIWFRKIVDIPETWAGKELTLSLGAIDDFDWTYFNGIQVGAIGHETPNSYLVRRKYTIPASLVHTGNNTIAVRVFDNFGDGGFTGSSADMSLSLKGDEQISLAGNWLYRVELGAGPVKADYSTKPAMPPGASNPNSPTVLYNAMIAPLISFSISGVIWYQGEANTERAIQYQTLFPEMIRNWRANWKQGDFPFLFVQLANYQARMSEPSESDWAELREAQLMSLREPETGMAVTIDIGDADDIHPRNKQEVGHRLALWALAKKYKIALEYSGPLYQSFQIEGNKIRVKFSHAEGLRTSDGSTVKGFAIASKDGKFVWANARIEGCEVVVWNDTVTQPLAVRYGWADNPEVNLYNSAGLPASPFRTDQHSVIP